MSDGDRPIDNDWVLGPEPLDLGIRGMGSVRSDQEKGIVRSRTKPGVVRMRPCLCCGAPTNRIRDKDFCPDCGYFESCCDGGKEAE